MSEEGKERFSAKEAVQLIDEQLDAVEIVLDSHEKSIESIAKKQEQIVVMLHKMSSALGLPKSILPNID